MNNCKLANKKMTTIEKIAYYENAIIKRERYITLLENQIAKASNKAMYNMTNDNILKECLSYIEKTTIKIQDTKNALYFYKGCLHRLIVK